MESEPIYDCNKEVAYLREYLQIESQHPYPDYGHCVDFLMKQSILIGLPLNIYYPSNKENPLVILTWEGLMPDLPSILLNSHMDVVPVYADKWSYSPFGAEMDKQGNIYARGAQNMKSVGMQYLAAVRYLKDNGAVFKRTIHLSFVPDSEMGGRYGMRLFAATAEFRALNVGFALDEGMPSPTEEIPVFYGERNVWRMLFKFVGTSGHGCFLLKNTVGEKFYKLLTFIMTIREDSIEQLKNNPDLTLGDVMSINMTRANAGIQCNVIPPDMVACFDFRLPVQIDHKEFENRIKTFCEDVGGGIEYEFEYKVPKIPPTVADDSNPYWACFKASIDELGIKIKPQIHYAATDSRYLRALGISALGFTPLNNTTLRFHDNDEYVPAKVFLKGIDIYIKLITDLASLPEVIQEVKEEQKKEGEEEEKEIMNEELMPEIKAEVKEEIKEEVKEEVKEEEKEEVTEEVKEEAKDEVKEEMKEEVKEEVKE